MSACRLYTYAVIGVLGTAAWSTELSAAHAPGMHDGMTHEGMAMPTQAENAPSAVDERAPFGMPMHDDHAIFHLLLEQLEYRDGQDAGIFHWEGQAWYGNDAHRLWVKSEGEISDNHFEHGRHELLYGRPVTPYFDVLAGLRSDIDDDPAETWLALGVQGLAPGFFHVSMTAYANADADLAFNGEASFDLLLTQRLILQPKIEVDLYTGNNQSRGIGSGFSAFEGGLRLRYEIDRKFAPYIGANYERKFGNTRAYAVADGQDPENLVLVAGVRTWF